MRWIAVLLLCVAAAGLAVLGLEGIARADALLLGTDLHDRQWIWLLMAAPVFVANALVPYRWWRSMAYPLLAVVTGMLVVVLLMPARNGARCWIPLGPFDVQPSEIAKVVVILALARYLEHRDHYEHVGRLLPPLCLLAIPTALILKEPDLGSAVLFVPIYLAMVWMAGARLKHLALLSAAVLVMLPVGWMTLGAEQRSRVTSWLQQVDGGLAPNDERWHQHQAKLMLVLGGENGGAHRDLLETTAAARQLPAGRTDFVFCMVVEQRGAWGASMVVVLYAVLAGAGVSLALGTCDPFGRMVATGGTALIAIQAAMNLGIAVGLLPVAGVTAPLMSYGGSSLVGVAWLLGLIASTAVHRTESLGFEPFRFRSSDLSARARQLAREGYGVLR